MNRLARPAALVLSIAVIATGCGQSTPTVAPSQAVAPVASGASPGVHPSSSGPASSTGPAGTPLVPPSPTSSAPTDVAPGPPAAQPRLPRPTLVEPFAIGQALYDPGQVGDGVVSLLQAMGVGIHDLDGTVVQAGDEQDAGDLRMTVPEVWGLIHEGVADLLADPDGTLPYTFADLHAGLAPFLPGVSVDRLARAYASAYERHPDDLVPGIMLGQPIEASTPLTRVHLWLLFADGYLKPAGRATASLGGSGRLVAAGSLLAAGGATWGTAGSAAPPMTAPAGLPALLDFPTFLERLRTLGYLGGFQLNGIPAIHEGHGGPGAAVTLTGGLGGAYSWPRGSFGPGFDETLLAYSPGTRRRLDIAFQSSDPGIWQSHGAVSVPFGTVQSTPGYARMTFQPRKEQADGHGELATDQVLVWVSANKADVLEMTYHFPIDRAALEHLAPGEMVSPEQAAAIDWHAKAGLRLTLTNDFDVSLGLRGVVGLGDASADGYDRAEGFLPLRDDGIYRGTMLAEGSTNIHCDFLGETVDDFLQDKQQLDVFAQVRPGRDRDPGLDVIAHGAFGPDDAHLTFYPSGPPIDSDLDCVGPVWSRGGGPLGRRNLTYKWFNDSRWTDPNLGYTIHLPKVGDSLEYEDWRLAKEALNGPGGISGVDSTWTINVDRVGDR